MHLCPQVKKEGTPQKRQRLRGICHQVSSCMELKSPRCLQETLEPPCCTAVHSSTHLTSAITRYLEVYRQHTPSTPLVMKYLRRFCSSFLTYGNKRTAYLKSQLPHKCRNTAPGLQEHLAASPPVCCLLKASSPQRPLGQPLSSSRPNARPGQLK